MDDAHGEWLVVARRVDDTASPGTVLGRYLTEARGRIVADKVKVRREFDQWKIWTMHKSTYKNDYRD